MEEEAAAMAAMLPDELLLEILVRIKDAEVLFHRATACKQWRHLITDLTFLQRRWPEDACRTSSSFVGFFTIEHRAFPTQEPCFVPVLRSA